MILVDTNVLLDLVENDPVWADWSQQQLEAASLQATLCINPVIYAELSIAFDTIEDLEAMLKQAEVQLETNPARGTVPCRKSVRQLPQEERREDRRIA